MSNLSIIVCVHNKEFMIREVLNRIKQHTDGAYELVIVLDGCTDGSEAIVNDWHASNKHITTKILMAPNVFETKANNIAAKASSGNHIIIVQDDVLISSPAWNLRLLSPFKKWDDVFAVTGRTAHNWRTHEGSESIYNSPPRSDQWCDVLRATDQADRTNTPRDVFAIRDTVNRSPLAINRRDLETMGYFDETFAPLDCCEHNLMYTMHKQLGKVCGGVWIDYESKPEWGGTRDANGNPRDWMYAAQQKNSRLLYERHKDYMDTHCIIENRSL